MLEGSQKYRVLFLISLVAGGFRVYAPSKLIVSNDTAATAANLKKEVQLSLPPGFRGLPDRVPVRYGLVHNHVRIAQTGEQGAIVACRLSDSWAPLFLASPNLFATGHHERFGILQTFSPTTTIH